MAQEQFVTEVLRHWGLEVTKIPESEEQTPDFLAIGGNSSYLIELKTKIPNPEVHLQRNAALNAGELFEEIIPMVRRNRLSGVIRKASDQLDAYDADDSLQLVWLHAEGHNASAYMDQFEIALYGSTSIADFSEKGTLGNCYFFTNSDFHRYAHVLDGAILSTREQAKICINPLSSKYEKMRTSFLCTTLDSGICDPYAREKRGEAYVVDGDVDRSNESEVIAYLREKYDKEKLMVMPMQRFSATVAVPHEE